jgi:hypothetical protein
MIICDQQLVYLSVRQAPQALPTYLTHEQSSKWLFILSLRRSFRALTVP